MSHPKPHSLDEIQERAALYALGALDDDEARELDAHLASGCETCRREVDAFQDVTVALATVASEVAPPATLRTRVFADIVQRDPLAEKPMLEVSGSRFVRTGGVEWREVAPSVYVKRLALDRESGRATQLVRLSPGAKFSRHRHLGAEESFVLEGDLVVCGVVMRPGDYCRASPGTSHDDVHSEQGCTFIAVSSVHDDYAVDEA